MKKEWFDNGSIVKATALFLFAINDMVILAIAGYQVVFRGDTEPTAWIQNIFWVQLGFILMSLGYHLGAIPKWGPPTLQSNTPPTSQPDS